MVGLGFVGVGCTLGSVWTGSTLGTGGVGSTLGTGGMVLAIIGVGTMAGMMVVDGGRTAGLVLVVGVVA